MEKLIGVVTLALMLVFAGAQIDRNADANTITELHDIALNGPDAVSYTFFSVTTGGLFNISGDGRPAFTLADPEIYLFTDIGSPGGALGALTGNFLAHNDNSGVGPCSVLAPNPCNSLITDFSLTPGNYVVAVGAHVLSEQSALFDTNNANSAGRVLVTIASANGVANLLQIPEPASFMLVGLGLLALRFALRRSRD